MSQVPTSDPSAHSALCLDHQVPHPEGLLFARQWRPGDSAATPGLAPVVMLHDSLGCVDLWRDFPAALCGATGRCVIAYDRLGFGRSAPRGSRPALDFVSREAIEYFPALRAHFNLERFVVLGHSVGGGMAIECAASTPDACAGLVTIAAQTFAEERTLQGIRAAQALFADPAQLERLARYHGDKAAWVLDAWVGNWLDPGFATWSLATVLPHVVCPVLAIHGELDEYGSARHPREIGVLATGPTKVALLPGVGHVPHREQPQQVLEMVAAFMASLP